MIDRLGERYFVTETSIKPYSVGYPIQAPLSAFLDLLREHGLKPETVERITVRLPEDGARIVNNRSMPDVNCQYILAAAQVDGKAQALIEPVLGSQRAKALIRAIGALEDVKDMATLTSLLSD